MTKWIFVPLLTITAFMIGMTKGRDIGLKEAPEVADRQAERTALLESVLVESVANHSTSPRTREDACDVFFDSASEILSKEWVHMFPEQERQ